MCDRGGNRRRNMELAIAIGMGNRHAQGLCAAVVAINLKPTSCDAARGRSDSVTVCSVQRFLRQMARGGLIQVGERPCALQVND